MKGREVMVNVYTFFIVLNFIFMLAVVVSLFKFSLVTFKFQKPYVSLLMIGLGIIVLHYIFKSFVMTQGAILYFSRSGEWFFSLKDIITVDLIAAILCGSIYVINRRANQRIDDEILANQNHPQHQAWNKTISEITNSKNQGKKETSNKAEE